MIFHFNGGFEKEAWLIWTMTNEVFGWTHFGRSVGPSCVCLLSEFIFIQLDATHKHSLARMHAHRSTLLLFSWTTQDNNDDLHSQWIELQTICFCPAYYYINFVAEMKKKHFFLDFSC